MVIKNKSKTSTKNKIIAMLFIVLAYLVVTKNYDINITPKREVDTSRSSITETLDASSLARRVIPEEGYTVNINWGDTGVKLVQAGGIDMAKYNENYSDPQYKELLSYLTENKNQGITINQENAYFWVNTLWALGLTQQSDVLSEGIMGTEYKDRVGSFASTGGWTLGNRDAISLFSSSSIIPLTPEQQQFVTKISENIYRPCCGNPTSFPDCNHGMAILGLLELMASQGATEDEMYKASLAFNSYWFSTTYVDLAYYFKTEKGLDWEDVDPKLALSAEYSSAPGYQTIKKEIGNIPGTEQVGASCGA